MKLTQSSLIEALQQIKTDIEKAGHKALAEECDQLLRKTNELEYAIAFCGHFSAGKSTMINELMGTELLPSSPIPTSANVVKITSGKPYVKVGFTQKEEKIFNYPYNLSDIQEYCTDGDLVEYVEISHDTNNLPPHVAILDTPGIDSTDDAHRVSAESRLYLADLVIYVMDYNHVQSALNYQFIEDLSNKEKKTFLIVNQIDKHISSEGSFEQYQEQILQSFQEHGLKNAQVFFTSMKDIHHPHNQLTDFKENVAKEISKRKSIVLTNVLQESKLLINGHMDWVQTGQKQELDLLKASLKGTSVRELERKMKELQVERESLDQRAEQFEQGFHERLKVTLTNANLIPYHTREYARQFLESRQLGFKAGGLFSRKKTKQEMAERLTRFHESLCSNIDISLDIHVKKLFEDYYREHHLTNTTLKENIDRFKVDISPEFLIEKMNRSAIFSHESARNYCSQLIHAIHQQYTRAALAQIQEAQACLNEQIIHREKQLDEHIAALKRKLEAAKRLKAILEGNEKIDRKLRSILAFDPVNEKDGLEEAASAFAMSQESRPTDPLKGIHIGRVAMKMKKAASESPDLFDDSVKEQLHSASAILSRFTDLKPMADRIEHKLQTVNNRRFTIALFGAFSAGKSSFANALIGKTVLPVSPNPTTAVINEILPPDSHYAHGTVRLFFKKETELLQDVNRVLEAAGQSAESLEKLETLVRRHDEMVKYRNQSEAQKERKDQEEREEIKPLLELLPRQGMQFLRAVIAGRSDGEVRLGSIQQTDFSQFETNVQAEEKACYIEKVQLYYDCPLTRKGIVLVDTPGADSINSRHTEVAFDYTTKADAVLFVTYYNHAFSKSDREFLIQLGRVKDYFDQDKMFFIVNACDLASSEREVVDVLSHVEKNLLTCGIRRAQIFPVSSHIALLAQTSLNKDEQERYKHLTKTNALSREEGLAFSGLTAFNDSFFKFIFKELPAVVIKSAIAEVHKAKKTLAKWIELQKKSAEEKKKLLLELERASEKSVHLIQTLDFASEQKRLNQEITELLYFVKQRVFLRYRDEFNQIFTPSVLKGADQKSLAVIMQQCLLDVVGFVTLDVAQELRATAFRLEVYLRKMEQLIFQQVERQLQEFSSDIRLNAASFEGMERPSFQEGLPLSETIDWKNDLPDISSGSAFFIEGMNLTLRDKLDHQLRQPVEEYINENDPVLRQFCDEAFKEIISFAKRDIHKQIESHFSGQMNVLKQGNISNRVESSYREIKDKLTYISSK